MRLLSGLVAARETFCAPVVRQLAPSCGGPQRTRADSAVSRHQTKGAANPAVFACPGDGAYRDRTGDLRLAKPVHKGRGSHARAGFCLDRSLLGLDHLPWRRDGVGSAKLCGAWKGSREGGKRRNGLVGRCRWCSTLPSVRALGANLRNLRRGLRCRRSATQALLRSSKIVSARAAMSRLQVAAPSRCWQRQPAFSRSRCGFTRAKNAPST
jgi:hypothetical protein